MKLSEYGEFGLIDRIREEFKVPDGVDGIGDDCAIIPQSGGMDTLVSTDMLMEGTHFLLDDISPRQLGWKSAAVNFSDIAAMGGRPVGSFLAFSLPRSLPGGWVEEFMRGYAEISSEYGFPLLGGDTTSSPDRLCICVTVLGQCLSGRARRRSAAVTGDLVCVTGTLGNSACGLEVVLRGLPREGRNARLVDVHYRPRPRMDEGVSLASCDGVHAMMDISDGVASDLRHILDESHCGAEVDVDLLPVSDDVRGFCREYGLDPIEKSLCGGEDYELLFTVSPEAEPLLNVSHSVIGKITSGRELAWIGTDGLYDGFKHF